MRSIAIILCGVFLLFANVAAAQESPVGKTVAAKIEVPIRVAPPSGIPLTPGDVMFKARPDQRFAVVDMKTIQALVYTDTWIMVRSDDGRQGWAYWGKDLQSSDNFAVE